MARVAPGAGARATLPGEVSLLGLGIVADEASGQAVETSLSALYDALLPYREGDYPNFVEEEADASAFFDAEAWARLREIKAAYDPTDVFKGNHHIPPAA
jgi:FAD/FMN-containing dehydrogenase